MKAYLELFLAFAKMGVVLFGGGYAMLPLLEKEVVDKRGWATRDEILDYLAIGQTTPGIIAINICSFLGYRRKGWGGAFVATLGFVFPALVIISIIAGVLAELSDLPVVQHAFGGIRIVVAALIADTLVKFSKGAIKDRWGILLGLFALGGSLFFRTSPILIVLTASLVGILIYRVRNPAGLMKEERQ